MATKPTSPAPNRQSQTALVTGASSGIGLELATLCGQNGYNLVLVARSAPRLEAIAADFAHAYNVQVTTIIQDLSKADAAAKVAARLEADGLSVDVLINNAGVGLSGRFAGQDPAALTRMLAVNVTALTELTRLLLPAMLERGAGRILNVASIAGFMPCPNLAAYGATKAYVLSWSVALNQELRGSGVTATALCPGATKTNFARTARVANPDAFGRGHLDAHAVARIGYVAMLRGAAIAVPGLRNRLAILGSHLVSRTMIARINTGTHTAHE